MLLKATGLLGPPLLHLLAPRPERGWGCRQLEDRVGGQGGVAKELREVERYDLLGVVYGAGLSLARAAAAGREETGEQKQRYIFHDAVPRRLNLQFLRRKKAEPALEIALV